MKNFNQNKNLHRGNDLTSGFSLVEMLVAIGIFMSIMTIAVSSLISIIDANKKAQAIKSTIDSVTFALEDMSRDMRVGTNYWCSIDGVTFNSTKDCTGGGTAVRYINNSNRGITYNFFGTGQLTKMDCDANFSNCNPAADLISVDSNANITDMKFYVIGSDNELVAPRTQPRVIITASGLVSVSGSSNKSSFNLQTNISQRVRR